MKPISRLFASTAVSLCIALPAMADVTAPQIWERWKGMAQDLGQTMTVGSETMADGTLTLTDVAIGMKTADGTVDGTLANVTLAEQGDGTVAITMSPEYPLRVSMKPEGGAAVDFTLLISMPELKTIASGDDTTVRYDITGPELTATIDDMQPEGEPVSVDMTARMTELTGTYTVTEGDDLTFDGTLHAATLGFDMSGTDDEEGGFNASAAYSDVTTTSSGTGKGFAAMADPAKMFAEGATYASTYTHGGGSLTVTGDDPESGSFNWKSTTESGNLTASVKEGLFEYLGGAKGLNMAVSGDQIPFPELTAAMDEFAFGVNGPLAETDDPKDVGLLVNMSNLTVSDFIWSIVDPDGVLPRDPATVLLDLTGTAKMLVDFADPMAMEGDAPPAELHTLNLRGLRVAVAGAELTGQGGFTFDNSDMETFGGFPAPEGAVDLKLVGGNALLDGLVKLGLIPEDQAMGARMMLGLFAVPSGDDTLDSKIEISPEGGISANGQRLQ
ncbi:DUF2125 domain-containing protein [Oceaniglobus trochenteri]|uniref:DUF2125 domain-containing protein n=1 Tax=Oceaniglobus trochenteri TaxID=2763260 RepID=UPI001CFFA13F|nr:DUF2125 domain-containing protein [Oceaniglobus trochenteri]